ncbi:hypothetical protein DCS_00334 [Drechmeria coniospora]|uniref:Cell wall protein n=1 Tax=Drechmeria coniospora TaxID=98403 RepID=A0A151GQ08_DRECN|nr:hypothetical protein DCS_00334 [Drechmeria coniospora]KYK59204.1 hypothetical protein DCS_00334 [Drechmeria coniospora]
MKFTSAIIFATVASVTVASPTVAPPTVAPPEVASAGVSESSNYAVVKEAVMHIHSRMKILSRQTNAFSSESGSLTNMFLTFQMSIYDSMLKIANTTAPKLGLDDAKSLTQVSELILLDRGRTVLNPLETKMASIIAAENCCYINQVLNLFGECIDAFYKAVDSRLVSYYAVGSTEARNEPKRILKIQYEDFNSYLGDMKQKFLPSCASGRLEYNVVEKRDT